MPARVTFRRRIHPVIAACSLLVIASCGSDDAGPYSSFNTPDASVDARMDSSSTGGSPPSEAGGAGGIQFTMGGTGNSPFAAGGFPTGGGAGAGGTDSASGKPDGGISTEGGLEGGDASESGAPDCGPVGTQAVPTDACDAYAVARCTRLEACQLYQLRYEFGDQSTCRIIKRRECERKYGLPGQPASLLAAVHDCAALLVNAPCACVLDEVCTVVSGAGTLPNGAPCRESNQCAGGLCDLSSGADCGACATGGKAGDPCDTFSPPCGAGLVCGTSQACVKPIARGGFCLDASECQEGLACVDAKCSAPLGQDASCDSNPDACDSGVGLSCLGGVCTELGIASAGADGGGACGFGQDGSFTACDAFSRCSGSQCTPKDGPGAACDPISSTTNPTCMPTLFCDPIQRECAAFVLAACVPMDGGLDGG
jgi:hypothetical protein